jgi:hypothetical protein
VFIDLGLKTLDGYLQEFRFLVNRERGFLNGLHTRKTFTLLELQVVEIVCESGFGKRCNRRVGGLDRYGLD